MSRQGGGFGFVMLLVVLAVVLLIAAKAWKSAAPTALEVATPVGDVTISDHGASEAAGQVRPGGLPGLSDMRRETGTHTQQVEETLQQID